MLEATVASVILVVGLVGLASLFSPSLTSLEYTRQDLIAKQKAREALESVYSARNDGTIGFAGIQNVSNGGIFVDGFQSLYPAGHERDRRFEHTDDDSRSPDFAGAGWDCRHRRTTRSFRW